MYEARTVAIAFACLAFALALSAADAAPDIVPAPGGPPMHLHITQTSSGPDGPRTTTTDVVVRRTGPSTAALERNADVVPLSVDANGALRPDPAAVAGQAADVLDIVETLNIAHGVTGTAGAGSRSGWNAEIPPPSRPTAPSGPPPSFSSPSPAATPSAPLLLPIRALALNATDLDIDGSVETSLAPPAEVMHGSQHSHGGGGFGGFGGFGGRGGFGGPRRGEGSGDFDGPPRGAPAPITLDIHVAGRLVRDALTRLTITQTRRVTLDGLTYTNVGTAAIDVLH
jgi:hypothetical protein